MGLDGLLADRQVPGDLPVAVAGIAGGLALLRNSSSRGKPKLSVPSTLIGSAALFGIVFGTARTQTDGWGAALTITSLAAGAALLAGFVVLQRYDRSPLIPLRVLADRNRGAAYLTLAVANAALFAVFLFLTYYFQGILRYSPVKTGLAFLPLPAAIGAVATITQGQLLKKFTMRAIVTGGLIACAAGAALLTWASATTSYAAWVLPALTCSAPGSARLAWCRSRSGSRRQPAARRRSRRRTDQHVVAAARRKTLASLAATPP